MSKKIAFIVEGVKTETKILNYIKKQFFCNYDFEFITLPAEQNIYMLWKTINDDSFGEFLDVIEIIKDNNPGKYDNYIQESFSEIYLFFDCDLHHNNLSRNESCKTLDILSKMLNTFDNEAEQGKLYISYPMVEAINDYVEDKNCMSIGNCVITKNMLNKYKSSVVQKHTLGHPFSKDQWKKIFEVFITKLSCLKKEEINYETYSNSITPNSIFILELEFLKNDKIFILSGIPEFLLDYFKKDFWDIYFNDFDTKYKDCDLKFNT